MRKILLIAALLLPLAAEARMPWLLPNATVATGKEAIVTIDAAASENLFIFEQALKLEQLVITAPATSGSRRRTAWRRATARAST